MYQAVNLIESVRKDPHHFIEEKRLTLLESFLLDYCKKNKIETYSFDRFCQNFYGETTEINGFQAILKYDNDDEKKAYDDFFKIYDQYFDTVFQVDSRYIVHRLLYIALIEIRALSGEKDIDQIFKLSNLFHNVPLKILNKKTLEQYDEILENIVKDALPDKYLRTFIFNNFTELENCFWEVWQDEDSQTLVHRDQHYQPKIGEKKIAEFFCISYHKAKKIPHEN